MFGVKLGDSYLTDRCTTQQVPVYPWATAEEAAERARLSVLSHVTWWVVEAPSVNRSLRYAEHLEWALYTLEDEPVAKHAEIGDLPPSHTYLLELLDKIEAQCTKHKSELSRINR